MQKYKWFIVVAVLAVALFALTGCGGGEADTGKDGAVKLGMATMEVGTGYYNYGSIFSEKIREALPEGSSVDVLPYSGAIGNVKMVSVGEEAQIALTSPFLVKWAQEGILAFEGEKLDNVRLLVAGLDTYFFAPIARKDAPFNSLKEIADKQMKVNLATQKPGSLGDYGGKLVLEAYGLTHEKIKEWGGKAEMNDQQVIADDMRNGRIDFDLEYFNLGHPAVTELATQTDVKFLSLEPEIIDMLCEQYGFEPVTLPAGSFPGQDEDVQLVGGSSAVITNTDLPDDIAYAITKARVENHEYFKENLKALNQFTPERAVQFTADIPFHPGAEKYLKEAGLLE
jgi:TRAP transporter TAXI family solute receptor